MFTCAGALFCKLYDIESPVLLFFASALSLRMCRQQVADANARALTQALKACAQLGSPQRLPGLIRKIEVGKFEPTWVHGGQFKIMNVYFSLLIHT